MADYANDRMKAAGVQVVPTIVIVMELMGDWLRATPGFTKLSPYIDRYLPYYGTGARNPGRWYNFCTMYPRTYSTARSDLVICLESIHFWPLTPVEHATRH
ncbi:hypothetical protein PM082_020282 [Marasmius tenuissimus]|nr:hypothetical protein PM082_020282 [Marasmius tenuissimus]